MFPYLNFGSLLKIRRRKTEWYDQENYQRNYEKLQEQKREFSEWERAFQLLKNWLQKLNESTMYISVFIRLSTTLPEVNQRGKENNCL